MDHNIHGSHLWSGKLQGRVNPRRSTNSTNLNIKGKESMLECKYNLFIIYKAHCDDDYNVL